MKNRVGIIAIDPELLVQILHAPESSKYDLITAPLDTIQAALLLPDGYTVRGIFFDGWRRCYGVFVEHDSFPEVVEGEMLPEVRPTYIRNADGTTSIVNIEVYVPPNFYPWHPITPPEGNPA